MTIKDAIAASRRGDYADAISLFRPLADQGDADAQYGLGRIYLDHGEYFENKDVPLNDDNEIQAFNDRWDEGAKWFRLAADQGHARAQCRLGSMYLRGDYAEATRLLRLAADQGHAGAQWILGCAFAGNISPGSQRRHWQRGDAEAVKWFRLAANQGHLEAQYKLGTMYLKGSDEGEDLGYIYLKDQNVPQDYAEAAKWLRLAAEQGHLEAQYKLGFIYHNGPDEPWEEYGHIYLNRDVPKDYAEAAKWLRLAANQGRAKAQCKLGFMYHEGRGVPQDYVLAHMWLTLSALRGEPDAVIGRFTVARCMTPAQFAEAKKLAREWKPSK